MGKVVVLEDDPRFEIMRYPTKAELIQQAIDIIASIETLGSCAGDDALYTASLSLVNARQIVQLACYRGGGL